MKLMKLFFASSILMVNTSCKNKKEQTTGTKVFVSENLRGQDSMNDKVLALTIDDGPFEATWKIFDELNKINAEFPSEDGCAVKMTFFVVGRQIKDAQYQKYVEKIVNDPRKCYIIANHTFSHPVGPALQNSLASEIKKGHESIKNLMIPGQVRFFRAPGGTKINATTANNAAPEDYVGPIYWDIGGGISGASNNPSDAADWACWSSKNRPEGWNDENAIDLCLKGYLNKTERLGRGVVLFHDVKGNSAILLPRYIRTLLAKGYKFVRLDEIESFTKLAKNRVGSTPTTSQPSPIVAEPSTPCTVKLKGACVDQSTCNQISSGNNDLSKQFQHFELLKGQSNLFVPKYCPNTPSAIKCCYNPAEGTLGLMASSSEYAFENADSNDQIPVITRLTSENNTCSITKNDLTSNSFYLYSDRNESKKGCTNEDLENLKSFRKDDPRKYLKELKNFAQLCYQTSAMASFAGYGESNNQKIVDFNLTGIKESGENSTFAGALTLNFNQNNQMELGNINLHNGIIQEKIMETVITLNSKTSDESEDAPPPHFVNFDLKATAMIEDTCAMSWSGNMTLSKTTGTQDLYPTKEFLILPTSLY